MNNLEKTVKIVDGFLNCIPVVSTVTNGMKAMYRSAYKVDTLNPATTGKTPSLLATIQIHVLNEDSKDLWIASAPFIGNGIKLIEFVKNIISGFEDDLTKAVRQNKPEIVKLCLANGMLDKRADSVLRAAAADSTEEIFQLILWHKQDWGTRSLANALPFCANGEQYTETQLANAQNILQYHANKGSAQLHPSDVDAKNRCIPVLVKFFMIRKITLAQQVLKMIPDTSLPDIAGVLTAYSQALKNSDNQNIEGNTSSPTERNGKASIQQLKAYFDLLAKAPKTSNRSTELAILDLLLDRATLSEDELMQFINYTLSCNDMDLIKYFILKHHDDLPENAPNAILKTLLDSKKSFAEKLQLLRALFLEDDSEAFIPLFAQCASFKDEYCIELIATNPPLANILPFAAFIAEKRSDLNARINDRLYPKTS